MKTNNKSKTHATDAEAGFIIGFIILTLLTVFLSSCSKDDEVKGPDTRSLFVGTYDVEDVSSGTGYNYYYDVTITNGSGNQVNISNFADLFNVPVKAMVNGNALVIPSQNFTNPSGKTITVEGSGTLENNVLKFTYVTTGYLDYFGTCTAKKK